MYLNYQGDASATRPFPIAGEIVGSLEAKSNAATLGLLYTFEPKILGAHFTLGMFVPYVWMDVSAMVTLGPSSVERRSRGWNRRPHVYPGNAENARMKLKAWQFQNNLLG